MFRDAFIFEHYNVNCVMNKKLSLCPCRLQISGHAQFAEHY